LVAVGAGWAEFAEPGGGGAVGGVDPPKVVQERLGHHSPAFTQSTYQHLLPGMGEAEARRFEALVLEPGDGETPS
jgi:integrase